MATTRNVRQNQSGQWEVLKEGHWRSADPAATERTALARARAQVRREGGGEVRVFDRTGKVVKASRVGAPRRSR